MTEGSMAKPACFVVMPISDQGDYPSGHFTRVYNYLIKPACIDAGFDPVRADEVKNTNHIVLDVLKRLLTADLVICDLSSKNPNVLCELGIRQAFDRPVALIKDNKTDRIFDIQGIRTHDYDDSLRIDSVTNDKSKISAMLKATYEAKETDVNSLVRLLGISRAEIKDKATLSPDSIILLNAMRDLSERIGSIEKYTRESRKWDYVIDIPERKRNRSMPSFRLPNGEPVDVGYPVFDSDGSHLGLFQSVDQSGVVLLDDAHAAFVVTPDSDKYMRLTTLPF